MARPHLVLALALALAASCAPPRLSEKPIAVAEPPPAPSAPATGAGPEAASPAPTLELAPRVHHGIPWYADAPDAALARARREQRLVLVDLWAPWCHTCLSMQEYVLTADKLGSAVERFVFLSIDTERPENASFLATLALSAWPTFYVLSPETPPVVRGRWVGGASAGQMVRFMADGERAHARGGAGDAPEEPLSRLVQADALAARGEFALAAETYRSALEDAPRDWSRRSDALVARASALKKSRSFVACVDMVQAERPAAEHPVSAADFCSILLACAGELPATDPRVRRTRKSVVETLVPLCERGHPELTPDDRGDACGTLIEAQEALKDVAGARKTAATRLALLEAAAAGVPHEIALMYDFARTEMLAKLGRGVEAVRLLEERERALPRNYNPPHYLARVHRVLGNYVEGLAAIERALALAYGPRRGGLMGVKVDLLRRAGRREEARRALAEQLELYRALPEGQQRPDAERAVRSELEKLGLP